MFSIRPDQRSTKASVSSRMKPPRQIRSILLASSTACIAASKPARSLPNGLLSMTSVAMPACRARARPAASGVLASTSTISAGKSAARAPSIRAAMLEPRPEMRMATRRFMRSP